MNQLLFDDEEYYFQITDELESDRQFILIIYDIVDNKRRTKFAKLLEGYGKRVHLASDMSSYVSGQVIQVDGGMNM